MTFAPIAIVGRGCVLSDALDPGTFWRNVAGGKLSIGEVPSDRWRLARSLALSTTEGTDHAWTDVGGYVRGFEFDPAGVDLEADLPLDPLSRWTLHAAREALREAGQDGPSPRAGLVMGNLSFPSAGLSSYAEQHWLAAQDSAVRAALAGFGGAPASARWRFSSGLPAHLTARALGLGAGAFALDAACASALYAIKLGCDRLHDGSADLMLAGAVNCPDDLFIHVGFTALSALSRTGRSRPFHRAADGLIPAEGAVFVALMRLTDALAAGTEVLGVIRGIGLSNDGRGGGVLAPAEEGQRRAMLAAYEAAGFGPETVSLIECHATGTPVGDAVEARSLARVFADRDDLPIGSVKSNIGHLITAAGGAGLLKVLGAMHAGVRPPSLAAGEPIDALADTPLRLLAEAEEWTGPRRAAVSAFGFGGNNAHLVVDEWTGDVGRAVEPLPRSGSDSRQVALVAVAVRAGGGRDTHEFATALFDGKPVDGVADTVDVALTGLKFPPVDLEHTLAQQLLVLEAAREAVEGLRLPPERIMVLIGMGCDAEVARYGARWRMKSIVDESAHRNAFVAPLTAAGVVGTMPNIVANRLNVQFGFTGPSFAVSAEEASGTVALELAARAIRAGDADAAVVGAVDLSAEPVHQAAIAALGHDRRSGDAAVVLVLKPLPSAWRDGDKVLALLDPTTGGAADLVVGVGEQVDPTATFGHPHAATGLLAVATAALALHQPAVPRAGSPADPAFGAATAEAVVTPLEAPQARIRLRAAEIAGWLPEAPPRLHVYSGSDRASVLDTLAAGRESDHGPARLALLAVDAAQRAAQAEAARRWLAEGGPRPDGMAFREKPAGGEVGFVFSGGSMAYHGMGRGLLRAFPEVVAAVEKRYGPLGEVVGWAYQGHDDGRRHVLDQIWGASLLGQVHAGITRDVLGLRPAAVLGYSSGETNALSAMGVWTDIESLVHDARASELFSCDLVGEIAAVKRFWSRIGVDGERWVSYLVQAPVERVRVALDGEPAVHLMTINSPESTVIGGEEAGCERVLVRLGSSVAVKIDYEIAVHAPEVREVRDAWWRLHHRPVTPLPGVRFYTGATSTWYRPDATSAADALTGQALGTIDFATMVENAWQDGVRVFVEHGPRALCTGWIGQTLSGREHLAVALDSSGHDVRRLVEAVTELAAAGVPMRHSALFDRLAALTPRRYDVGRHLTLPAHPPAVRLPDLIAPAAPADVVETMAPAPVNPAAALPTTQPVAVADRPLSAAQVHRRFLARQAQVHQQFLAGRQRAVDLLLATAGGAALAPRTAEPAVHEPGQLPGPKFDRAQLEHLAGGRISELFGPEFAPQDGYAVQTRMPRPPMLLADRVTGIDAAAASMGTGRIWTETDVRPDSWYLDPAGRIPPGLMVEAGQADLLLISWLGIDLLNRGERAYRLLGSDLCYHGSPAAPGETLRFEISIDGHGEHGGIRLFFFHYDCYVDGDLRMTVRNGRAGFFTTAELAESRGVLWDPAEQAAPPGEVEPPILLPAARTFGPAELAAFADGRPADCFGPGWARSRAHVRSPRLGDEKMLVLNEISEFDPHGGPWGRGYLRAETPVRPDDWYFDGHFLNDPCMPGTLMFDGCLQAMSFYLAATGHTLERDGWRFEPVRGETIPMRCRGQVTPESKHVVYEVFVSALTAGPEPALIADVLVTVDGLKAFHAANVGLRLVPDWPLAHWRQLGAHAEQVDGRPVPVSTLGGLAGYVEPKPVAEVDGFRFGYASLLACAWGRPSEAFGPPYRVFDGARRVARLPGPPYHFMSRITAVHGRTFGMEIGSWVEAEYDVPAEVWYFEQNGHPAMPFGVLMEVALQPCGWLASYVGSALGSETDLLFRNLDGDGVVTGEIGPGTTTIRTRAELTSVSRGGDMIIESFAVKCYADDVEVFVLSTVFGYFPKEAFDNQVGLPPSDAERDRLAEPSDFRVDLTVRPEKYCHGTLRLAGPMLLMLDRVTGYWPEGGEAGLGRLRAEKDVDPGEWFFRAHFFQDPVQPGSLGIEALCQLVQFYLLENGFGAGIAGARFEPVQLDGAVNWKYRGQVVPANARITTEVEIVEVGEDERGRYAVAQGWLWADDKRIYHAPRLAVRVVRGVPAEPLAVETELDPATDHWLLDHRPTWTVPAVPMMSTVDIMAGAAMAATGQSVTELRDIRLRRWIPVPELVRIRTEVTGSGAERNVVCQSWRDAGRPGLSRFESAATATVRVEPAGPAPEPLAPPADATAVPDPYESGALFHGPAFRYLTALATGAAGSSGVLDAGAGSVPYGTLNQGLLDAATHVIPHDTLWRWSDRIGADKVGYPQRIPWLRLYESLPAEGEVRVEARFAGFDGDDPAFDVQLQARGRVLAEFRLVDVLLPKGRIGGAEPAPRRRFLRDREYTDGLGLSTTDSSGVTTLTAADVASCDWLPGTVAHAYRLTPGSRGQDRLAEIAIRDHVARLERVHPASVDVDPALTTAGGHAVRVTTGPDRVTVHSSPTGGVA